MVCPRQAATTNAASSAGTRTGTAHLAVASALPGRSTARREARHNRAHGFADHRHRDRHRDHTPAAPPSATCWEVAVLRPGDGTSWAPGRPAAMIRTSDRAGAVRGRGRAMPRRRTRDAPPPKRLRGGEGPNAWFGCCARGGHPVRPLVLQTGIPSPVPTPANPGHDLGWG